MSEIRDCPSCGMGGATVSMKRQEFEFLLDGALEMRIIHVPVISCGACGEEFTDYRAEEIWEATRVAAIAERCLGKTNG